MVCVLSPCLGRTGPLFRDRHRLLRPRSHVGSDAGQRLWRTPTSGQRGHCYFPMRPSYLAPPAWQEAAGTEHSHSPGKTRLQADTATVGSVLGLKAELLDHLTRGLGLCQPNQDARGRECCGPPASPAGPRCRLSHSHPGKDPESLARGPETSRPGQLAFQTMRTRIPVLLTNVLKQAAVIRYLNGELSVQTLQNTACPVLTAEAAHYLSADGMKSPSATRWM